MNFHFRPKVLCKKHSQIIFLCKMAGKFLVSIDVKKPPTRERQGLDLETLSFTKNILITASRTNLEEISTFVKKRNHRFFIYCDCTSLSDLDTILNLLNDGCSKVLITQEQHAHISEQGPLPSESLDRLISVSGADKPLTILDEIIVEKYLETVKSGSITVVPSHQLTADPSTYPQLFPYHKLITSLLKSDRLDGLFPTVVSDERGTCLGLVYSNEASIQKAVEMGRGVYFSRSKNGLWIKGSESGDTQDLLSIEWDCDADALQFKVVQKGIGE